jgi:hypothetical protein
MGICVMDVRIQRKLLAGRVIIHKSTKGRLARNDTIESIPGGNTSQNFC